MQNFSHLRVLSTNFLNILALCLRLRNDLYCVGWGVKLCSVPLAFYRTYARQCTYSDCQSFL